MFNGFYCRKCNSIPLIEIVPDYKDTSIFFVCKCKKRYLPIDIFNNNYYQKNIKKEKISLLNTNNDENKKIENENEMQNQIKKNIDDYYKTKSIFLNYAKETKDNVIKEYMLIIQKINEAYEKYLFINKKIENFYEILIDSYKMIDDNISNIKNIINNSNFITLPKNPINTLDSLFSFYEKNFIIQTSPQAKLDYTFDDVLELSYFYYFNDYKINNDEYYGTCIAGNVSIHIYDLIENKQLFTFKGDEKKINMITLSAQNNIISCGEEGLIKIWPLIDQKKIIELNSKLIDNLEISIKPIYYMKCEENIIKIEYVINKDKNSNYDYLLAHSDNSIYLFKYMKNNTNFLDLMAKYNDEIIYDYYLLKRKSNHDIICTFSDNKVYLLNFPNLEKISEKNEIYINFRNNAVQINDEEILLEEYNTLTIFNVINFQKKLSIKVEGHIDYMTQLSDGTIIQGGSNGIKRYLKNNLMELPTLYKGYDNSFENFKGGWMDANDYKNLESILYIKELLDGRLLICYKRSGISILKLNIF